VKVLLVGSGGREHALAWKLAQSPALNELHAAPGNPGISALGRCHPLRMDDVEGLLALCRERAIDLVVIGPEAPLVAGIADELRRAGVAVFGPGRSAARIEGSKAFAKDVMRAAGVQTAAELERVRAPCVVKADGLAAGKGVFVCRTQAEAQEAWKRAQSLGDRIVVEELLEGEEVSVFAVTDGVDVVPIPPAQDFKRLGDGNEGPNTGGMGSYSPVPGFGDAEIEALADAVHRPIVEAMANRGTPYRGVLYAGLMMTADGPRVLEYNCRFGDPETQAVLPRLRSDLLELCLASREDGGLSGIRAEFGEDWAVTVVLASAGYPASSSRGDVISGLEEAAALDAVEITHAGTALSDGQVVTAGGRVLNVTGLGPSAADARRRAYDAAERISFEGRQMRTDIAERALVTTIGGADG
jgi:phosphoribosylamine---glycine ligase